MFAYARLRRISSSREYSASPKRSPASQLIRPGLQDAPGAFVGSKVGGASKEPNMAKSRNIPQMNMGIEKHDLRCLP